MWTRPFYRQWADGDPAMSRGGSLRGGAPPTRAPSACFRAAALGGGPGRYILGSVDISPIVGYETGRDSEPAFMDMNLHAARRPGPCAAGVPASGP